MIPRMSPKVGGERTQPRGAESFTSSYELHFEMSRIFPWVLILLFVVPCHRAGDLTTESIQVESVSKSSQDDVYTEKYQPSSKSFVAEWSFDKPLWRNINSTVPQMREGAATWTDPDSGDWWLFGGHRSAVNNKVFRTNRDKVLKKNRFDKNTSKPIVTSGPLQKVTTKYFSDLWRYQPSERLWTRVYPSTSSSIPAPGGPDHLLTRPILCGGGGKLVKNPGMTNNYGNGGEVLHRTKNESFMEGAAAGGRGDGRVMAVYAPGSKPVDTVWLLEMNDTRLWTTYVCCDEDSSMTDKSEKSHGESHTMKTDGEVSQEKAGRFGSSMFVEQKISEKNGRNPKPEEGPPTFCPDFHTLTRPPITWCDKKSQALFALDITGYKVGLEDQKLPSKDYQNTSDTQDRENKTDVTESTKKVVTWIPRIWRFDLQLTQWDHILVENTSVFSNLWSCGKDTSLMHWTSLGKCLIVLCPLMGRPSNMLNSFSLCMNEGIPDIQTLGTVQLSQGAAQAKRWEISAVESSLSGHRYLLMAYGRLLDLWILERGSPKWSPLENIWQGAALKWFRANSGLYHLQIIEEGLGEDKKDDEEEEEEVEELEEGRALGIAHVGAIGIHAKNRFTEDGKRNSKYLNYKIQADSKLMDGVMEIFMVNPREGLDVSLREQGLFVIRISEDNGTIFGHKAEIHRGKSENGSINKEKDVEPTTSTGQPTEESYNSTTPMEFKNDGESEKITVTEQSFDMSLSTTLSMKDEESYSEMYDQNPGESEEEDDKWSPEWVLETNGSSPVLNESLLALVERENHEESHNELVKEINHDYSSIETGRMEESSTLTHDITTTVDEISAEGLIEVSEVANFEQDQTENIKVVRPLSISGNDLERGSITIGAFGSEQENGYPGTILFFVVSFSMFILLVAVVFLRRCIIINCQFASHHLPHRCRSNSSVLLKEPPPIRYSVIPDEVCYAGISSAPMPAPGSPIPPSSIHSTLNRPLTT